MDTVENITYQDMPDIFICSLERTKSYTDTYKFQKELRFSMALLQTVSLILL